MKHSEFEIGIVFYTAVGKWRCTDIGSRTIIAVGLNRQGDVSWYDGPPYAVAETVFDEDDLRGCRVDSTET